MRAVVDVNSGFPLICGRLDREVADGDVWSVLDNDDTVFVDILEGRGDNRLVAVGAFDCQSVGFRGAFH